MPQFEFSPAVQFKLFLISLYVYQLPEILTLFSYEHFLGEDILVMGFFFPLPENHSLRISLGR